MSIFASTTAMGVAFALLAAAFGIVVWVLAVPDRSRLSKKRRRPVARGKKPDKGALANAAQFATDAVDKALAARGVGLAAMVEQAGLKTPTTDLVLLTGIAALVLGTIVGILEGALFGLVTAAAVVAVAVFALRFLIGQRKKKFGEQLGETLQMLASSLRAGYSLPQAIQAMGVEAEVPTKDEFARVINETRVGRQLNDALLEVAARMDSEDFYWVAQAIAINREVGGNLADVLDGVAKTIRDRAQLHRQVEALSAEGKLSAYILMGLPFAIIGFLSFANPGYLNTLFIHPIGWIILGVGAVMLTVGGFWLKATVKIKF